MQQLNNLDSMGTQRTKINGNFTGISTLYTETLYVSPNGDDSDGSNWDKAYTTLNGALDAASIDVNDLTLILIAPNASGYDMNTTGDPEWEANVEIRAPHRIWSPITNSHGSATSILKLTGKASVSDLSFGQTGTVDGLIMTSSGYRVRNCGFNSTACTGAVNGLHIDGSAGLLLGGKIEGCQFLGHATRTTAMNLQNTKILEAKYINIHDALIGLSINGDATPTDNFFEHIDIGACATGISIATGESAHFEEIRLHGNTINITETAITGNLWNNIQGELAVNIYPEDRAGIEVACGNTIWGSDVEIRAGVAATKPFKVIGYSLDPSNEESTLIRLSADSGSTFFVTDVFATKKGKASGGGTATDFIFSKDTRISASALSPDSGRTVNVWIEVQEI